MCNGPLWNKILLFALPLMASSILQLLFNAADVVVVGRYAGKEALAAVGSNSALINLLINLFVGLSVGTNVVVARDLGAGRHDNVSRSVHTSITLALISGVGMAVFGVIMVRHLLEWMSSPTDVIDLATVYLRIYFLGMPANMLYNFGAAILRAQGDTQRPLYFLMAAGIVNVVLNLCFVIGLGMDVDGVALATIISQYISAALVLRCLMGETGPLHLELRKLRLEWSVVRRILQVGLPAGFQGIVFSLSNVVIQSSLNSFNDAALVAGSAASSNIENFVYAAMNSFYQTALTFCGQNYGAAKCKRVDKTLFLCVTFSMTTGLVLGNLAYLFGRPLVSIYAPGEEEVIRQALIRMSFICCPYLLGGFMDTMVGGLRGIGYSVIPMVVSLVGACGLRLVWVATVFPLFHSPATLYFSYPVTWTITGLAHLIFFLVARKHAYARLENPDPAVRANGSAPTKPRTDAFYPLRSAFLSIQPPQAQIQIPRKGHPQQIGQLEPPGQGVHLGKGADHPQDQFPQDDQPQQRRAPPAQAEKHDGPQGVGPQLAEEGGQRPLSPLPRLGPRHPGGAPAHQGVQRRPHHWEDRPGRGQGRLA